MLTTTICECGKQKHWKKASCKECESLRITQSATAGKASGMKEVSQVSESEQAQGVKMRVPKHMAPAYIRAGRVRTHAEIVMIDGSGLAWPKSQRAVDHLRNEGFEVVA